MIKLPPLKYAIPSKVLDETIELLGRCAIRLEVDAAALASVPGRAAKELAEERAREAELAGKLASFFGTL